MPTWRPASLAALGLALAGCGSLEPAELPPPAGPAPSPPLAAAPAGRVVPAAPAPGARTATAAGRTFTVDTAASELRALERGREVGRVRTCLEPVAVTTAGEGRAVAVLCARERVLDLHDAATLRRTGRATAGTGPTRLASDGGNYVYVVDAKAEAILVHRIVPELHPVRRYALLGGPYAIAHDDARRRLWVTLTAANELAELTAGARPRELRRHPSVRAPRAVAVGARGVVRVTGADAAQLLDPRRAR